MGVNRVYVAVGLERCEDWWGKRFFDMSRIKRATAYSLNEHGMLVMDTCLALVGGPDIQKFRHRGILQGMQNVARIYLRDAEWVSAEPALATDRQALMADFTLCHLVLQGHSREDVARGMGIEGREAVLRHVRAVESLVGAKIFASEGGIISPTSLGSAIRPFIEEWVDKWQGLLAIRRHVRGSQ